MNYFGHISFLEFLVKMYTTVCLIIDNVLCFTLIAFILLRIYAVCWCHSTFVVHYKQYNQPEYAGHQGKCVVHV